MSFNRKGTSLRDESYGTCAGRFPFTFIIIVSRLAWVESLIPKRGIRKETDRGMRRNDEVSKQKLAEHLCTIIKENWLWVLYFSVNCCNLHVWRRNLEVFIPPSFSSFFVSYSRNNYKRSSYSIFDISIKYLRQSGIKNRILTLILPFAC